MNTVLLQVGDLNLGLLALGQYRLSTRHTGNGPGSAPRKALLLGPSAETGCGAGLSLSPCHRDLGVWGPGVLPDGSPVSCLWSERTPEQ